MLTALGCDVAQGYAIARPMPVDAIVRWCREEGAADVRIAALAVKPSEKPRGDW